MHLTDFQRRMIVLGIGLVLILFGVAQGLFKFDINFKIADQATYILMLVAFMLLFSGRKKKKTGEEEKKPEEKN